MAAPGRAGFRTPPRGPKRRATRGGETAWAAVAPPSSVPTVPPTLGERVAGALCGFGTATVDITAAGTSARSPAAAPGADRGGVRGTADTPPAPDFGAAVTRAAVETDAADSVVVA